MITLLYKSGISGRLCISTLIEVNVDNRMEVEIDNMRSENVEVNNICLSCYNNGAEAPDYGYILVPGMDGRAADNLIYQIYHEGVFDARRYDIIWNPDAGDMPKIELAIKLQKENNLDFMEVEKEDRGQVYL